MTTGFLVLRNLKTSVFVDKKPDYRFNIKAYHAYYFLKFVQKHPDRVHYDYIQSGTVGCCGTELLLSKESLQDDVLLLLYCTYQLLLSSRVDPPGHCSRLIGVREPEGRVSVRELGVAISEEEWLSVTHACTHARTHTHTLLLGLKHVTEVVPDTLNRQGGFKENM